MSKNGFWVPAQIDDESEVKYSYESHSTLNLKGTPYVYCRYCGLVFLKNELTRWCIRMGCNNKYHPLFKQMVHKFTSRG